MSTGILMLIGVTVILGTFLIVFVIPFYREYYQIIKKEQREQEKAYASKKRPMRARNGLCEQQKH